jgi:hypothetical protein
VLEIAGKLGTPLRFDKAAPRRADEPMDPADMSGPAPMPVARKHGIRRAS